jgi:hypothetical protein
VVADVVGSKNRRALDSLALLICMMMGLQHSLVTRPDSGAVARTTHTTGIMTDLGIEAARWFRFWRAHLSRHVQIRLVVGTSPPALPPHVPKPVQLLTTVGMLVRASAAGAELAARSGRSSVVVPLVLPLGRGVLALASGWEWVGPEVRK